jgi:transposase InsO family protein
LPARDAVRARDEAVRRHVNPRHLRSGSGRWQVYLRRAPTLPHKERGIIVRFIEPGSPWQNGVNESCTGRFRDECLNRGLLESAQEAHGSARAFRHDFNDM